MTRSRALNSPQEASIEITHPWRHPGGKLVELGPHSLKQDELLAILIGSGISGRPALAIANSILDEYVGLHGIHRRASVDELAKIAGLGVKKAARILAAIELGRRLYKSKRPVKVASGAEANLFPGVQNSTEAKQETDQPSEASLLAAIVGSGIHRRAPKMIAEDLLCRFGSFLELFDKDMGEFLNIKGLNSVKIIRITAAMEIARRLSLAL